MTDFNEKVLDAIRDAHTGHKDNGDFYARLFNTLEHMCEEHKSDFTVHEDIFVTNLLREAEERIIWTDSDDEVDQDDPEIVW